MKILGLAACATFASFAALAQPAENPVMVHYHAYRAALAAGNVAAAETEAAAALAASKARDGEGGRTGVLADNLADVRLAAGHIGDAYEPALEASTIAAQNPAAGVDPLQARLLVGRAELTAQRQAAGRQHLLAALQEAKSHPELAGDAYDAAVALGMFLSSYDGDSDDAVSAWRFAGDFASAAAGDPQIALGEARLGEGMAGLRQAIRLTRNRRDMGASHLTVAHANFQSALDALNSAEGLLRRPALAQPQGVELTAVQQSYGQSLVWRAVLQAYLSSTANQSAAPLVEHPAPLGAASGPPICQANIEATPVPTYPLQSDGEFTVGGVAVRFLLNPDGAIRDERVAAVLPEDEGFAQAVQRAAVNWRVTRPPECSANTPLAPVAYIGIRFTLN
jgi:hypothetical protein